MKQKIRFKTWYWGKFVYEGDGFTLQNDGFEPYSEELHGWQHSWEAKQMNELQTNVLQALKFFGPLSIEDVKAKLQMRNIHATTFEVVNAVEFLEERKHLRSTDTDERGIFLCVYQGGI
jgi:hypothetical protein